MADIAGNSGVYFGQNNGIPRPLKGYGREATERTVEVFNRSEAACLPFPLARDARRTSDKKSQSQEYLRSRMTTVNGFPGWSRRISPTLTPWPTASRAVAPMP